MVQAVAAAMVEAVAMVEVGTDMATGTEATTGTGGTTGMTDRVQTALACQLLHHHDRSMAA
jgi:hypothetical protein